MKPVFFIKRKVDPEELRQVGPMVKGSWDITNEQREAIVKSGCTPPQPINGFLLIDSGAAHLGIDQGVAQRLGIESHNDREVWGVGGNGSVGVHKAVLRMSVTDMTGRPGVMQTVTEAWSIPGIEENHKKFELLKSDDPDARIIGILGRTILQFAHWSYNGLTGEIQMVFDESMQRPKNSS